MNTTQATPDYMPRMYRILREHCITGETQDVSEKHAPTPDSDYPARRKLLDEMRHTCLAIQGNYTGNYSFVAGEWGYHMVVCIESLVNRKA